MNVLKKVKRPMPTKCLWCDGPLEDGHDLWDIFISSSIICGNCEAKFKVKRQHFKIMGIRAESFYLYNDFFSDILIQYKECFDEALYPIFLWRYNKYIHYRYYDYTLVPMPSSNHKMEERGFNHLNLMFASCNLPFCDCLYKIDDVEQKKLSASNRKNIHLGLKDMEIPNKLLLVDDVCSTQTTLKKAIKLLANKHRKIRIVVVAYNSPKKNKSKKT